MAESSSPWPKSLESLDGHGLCRISVNNIVQTVLVEGTTEPFYVGILDPRRLNETKERKWQPLGGAIRLTDTGRRMMELVGGEMLGPKGSKESGDARFSIPTEKFVEVMNFFSRLRPAVFEDSATREIFEELSEKEFDAHPPILSHAEASRITSVTHGVLHDLPKYEGASGRFSKDMPFARVTYLSSITMPKDVFDKLRLCPLIHIFSKEEASRIVEMRMQGQNPRTDGGDELATTMMLQSKIPPVVASSDSLYLYEKNAELECAVFIALGEAIKGGRTDLEEILKNVVLADGSKVDITEEQIQMILNKEVPRIRALVDHV